MKLNLLSEAKQGICNEAFRRDALSGPGEIEDIVESSIQHYQQGRGGQQLAMFVAEQLEILLNHPDISDEIHYWKHCQYYRMARQWRWIASGSSPGKR